MTEKYLTAAKLRLEWHQSRAVMGFHIGNVFTPVVVADPDIRSMDNPVVQYDRNGRRGTLRLTGTDTFPLTEMTQELFHKIFRRDFGGNITTV